ncbi:MAG: guanitoxin biosynthesis heme-dependent pre-guanitoxin N-hydroxylase GntA [Ginsengibacter sp.]
MTLQSDAIINSFHSFLSQVDFPCVAAKDASAKGNIKIMIAAHMACPVDDKAILAFIYDFVNSYRQHRKGFQSLAVIFEEPLCSNEGMFEALMWQRLQALRNLDSKHFDYDKRVSPEPSSAAFSYSLMEEAFFVLALHPFSSRPARQYQYPALIFNPHEQFVQMKAGGTYDKMKTIVRRRDMNYSGSINPMLNDFGTTSEALQYSGTVYNDTWQCPLKNL